MKLCFTEDEVSAMKPVFVMSPCRLGEQLEPMVDLEVSLGAAVTAYEILRKVTQLQQPHMIKLRAAVDGQEAVVVQDCGDCPFYETDAYEGDVWCGHDRGKNLGFERQKPPPDWCPLRETPVLVKLFQE